MELDRVRDREMELDRVNVETGTSLMLIKMGYVTFMRLLQKSKHIHLLKSAIHSLKQGTNARCIESGDFTNEMVIVKNIESLGITTSLSLVVISFVFKLQSYFCHTESNLCVV